MRPLPNSAFSSAKKKLSWSTSGRTSDDRFGCSLKSEFDRIHNHAQPFSISVCCHQKFLRSDKSEVIKSMEQVLVRQKGRTHKPPDRDKLKTDSTARLPRRNPRHPKSIRAISVVQSEQQLKSTKDSVRIVGAQGHTLLAVLLRQPPAKSGSHPRLVGLKTDSQLQPEPSPFRRKNPTSLLPASSKTLLSFSCL